MGCISKYHSEGFLIKEIENMQLAKLAIERVQLILLKYDNIYYKYV